MKSLYNLIIFIIFSYSVNLVGLDANWHGKFEGDCKLEGSTSLSFEAILEIEPILDNEWTWVLTYIQDANVTVRNYKMIQQANSNGYILDENNGIFIQRRLFGDVILDMFAVKSQGQSTFLTGRTELVDGQKIVMEIPLWDMSSPFRSGTNTVDVESFDVSSLQSCSLHKVN